MAEIQSATNNICSSATNVSVSTSSGIPFCISELPNTGNYSWQVIPTGTILSVTASLMGSLDGVNWFQLDQMSQADQSWSSTKGNISFVTGKQVNYLRIDIGTVNGGGSVCALFSLFEPNR